MNKKVVIIIASVLVLTLVVFAVTYAYLNASHTSDVVGVKSGKIDITYKNDGEVSGTLLPSVDYSKGIYTTSKIKLENNSLTNLASIKLEVEEISDYLKNDALNWTLLINGEVKRSDDFSVLPTDNIITLYDNYELDENITEIKVYIWLNGDKTTNEMMDQAFKAKLYVETHQITGKE